MNNPSPAFSVIIPTYNRAHLLGRTLETVLAQDFSDFEVLVVDDGSIDNTEATVKGLNDQRLHYFKKQNGERGAARNYGAARARGQYLNFMDSDDWLYPHHLKAALQQITTLSNPEFFHLAYDYRTREGTFVKAVNDFESTLSSRLLFDNMLSCNGVFLRKDIAAAFPFEEDPALASSEDWELWIRLISRFPLHFSNEVTSTIVGHDDRSLSTITAEKVISRDILLIRHLQRDEEVMKVYGKRFDRFIADRYTFFMLCLLAEHRRPEVVRWALRACKIYPLILMDRRFLATFKKMIVG